MQITNDDVTNARPAYSEYLLKELDDEIAPAWSGWTRYLEVLRRLRLTKFTRQQFVEMFESLQDGAKFDLDVDGVLERFYAYSVVGFERSKGGGGLIHQFRYLDDNVRFNADARTFMVHRGLKEALELSESTEARDAGAELDWLGFLVQKFP